MKGGENCDGLGAFGGGLPSVEGGGIPVRETRRVGDVEGDGVKEEGVRLMCVMCFRFGGVWVVKIGKGTMSSKGKEVVVVDPSLKMTRKGKEGASSSASKVGPARKSLLALELLAIWDKIRELGVGYIFNELGRCNVTLVRKFYANWNTSFRESTK
ncbi:hypothetical protein HAX54_046591, partial [Datura stramonium]|nr:hypothetical protein [Datura stramonium]